MNKQPKAWVESLLVAYVDNQLEPAQMAAVEQAIRDDPEAQAIVGVLRRSAAAVKTAYDQPLQEPVPARLLAAIGAAEASAAANNVVPLRRTVRLLPSRQASMALAASILALAVGFGAGYMQGTPDAIITIAGEPSERFEVALRRLLDQDQPGAQLSYEGDAPGTTEILTIVGTVTSGVSDDCREFRHDSAGATVGRGLACRSGSGDWFTLTLPVAPAT